MIAEIIIDILNKQVNRSFDYIIPSHLEGIIKVGFRVYVPFGKTKRVGFVINIKDNSDYKTDKLKEIYSLIDIYPVLNEEFIDIAKYIANNNFSFYATALQTMIPTALKIKYKHIARLINPDNVSIDVKNIFKRNEINIDNLNEDKLKLVYEEVKNGNIILDTKVHKKKDSNEITYVVLNDCDVNNISKQGKGLLSYLNEINEPIELSLLIDDMGYSKSVINTLKQKNAISFIKKEIIPNKSYNFDAQAKEVELNEQQKRAFNSVDLSKNKEYLLHGVTGSGKTEVYIRLISKVITMGKNALMLVPEISLTPQITGLFIQKFGSNIAIIHSRLTPNEKYNEWKKIINKEVKIVVGARSAIFAPIDNLGIIIVDECHESSYIQQNNPKYNAIEIAKLRCKNYNCPLILGSATPNVCDYYYAINGDYELLSMPNRANNKLLPECEVIDLRKELACGNKSVFSYRLQQEIKECYKRNEQSILFLNRRGYSSFVMCRSCGSVVKCPHCDVSLTYHAYNQTLKCHHCGHTEPNTTKCYSCGSDKIRFVGSGTEKIIDEVNKLIPEARVLRVDLDTTNKMEDYELAFKKFRNHEADIIVGTQMVAKGLDFENVTLVGVINADLALLYPTYDASMVCFNLLEQVSGRAGRALKDGKVIIQTYNPSHYVIDCAKRHDYEGFFNFEIKNRRLTMMPPFAQAIEIKVSSAKASLAYDEAKRIVEELKKVSKKSIILGPTEAIIFKKNDIYSFNIQIQAVDDEILNRIKYIYPVYQNNKDVYLTITRM